MRMHARAVLARSLPHRCAKPLEAEAVPSPLHAAASAANARGPPTAKAVTFVDPATLAKIRVPVAGGMKELPPPPGAKKPPPPEMIIPKLWLVRRPAGDFWWAAGGAERPMYSVELKVGSAFGPFVKADTKQPGHVGLWPGRKKKQRAMDASTASAHQIRVNMVRTGEIERRRSRELPSVGKQLQSALQVLQALQAK